MYRYDISIIIPFYYGNKQLPELLNNLEEAINYANNLKVEIIIVNDSPDCSVDFNDSTLNIKVVQNEQNMGIHKARVNGILNSCGKYIYMLDQDDLINKKTLKDQFEQIGLADIIVANGYDENPLNKGEIYHSKKHQEKCYNLKYYLNIGCMIVSPGQCLIKKTALPKEWLEYQVKNNGADDLLLWLLMLKKNNKFIINEEVLYRHTYSGENVSCNLDKMITSSMEVIDYLTDKNFLNKAQRKKYIRRLKMRKFYEGKGKIKKILAMILYLDISYYLIKMKLE